MVFDEDIRPVSDLSKNADRIVREISESSRPVLFTKDGTHNVVMMDARVYRQWQETLALLKMIAQAEADLAAGHTCSTKEAFARMRTAIRRASDE